MLNNFNNTSEAKQDPVVPASSNPTSGRQDIDLIIPNLYLGSLEAAEQPGYLSGLGVTRVLTIAETPIDLTYRQKYTGYLFKQLVDAPWSDLLHVLNDSIEFIRDGLNSSTGVFVHCRYGMSRSASVVIAYLMKTQQLTYQDALRFVQSKRRSVKPNMGFAKQLKFFETLNYELDYANSRVLRAYRMDRIAQYKQMGIKIESLMLSQEDEASVASAASDSSTACYKCRKCRTALFTKEKKIGHAKGGDDNQPGNTQIDWKSKLDSYSRLASSTGKEAKQIVCEEEIFIEPLSWLKDKIEDMNGKIHCPKCDAKLGSFDWSGSVCACGAWVTPAFHIVKSKVDFCQPATRTPTPTALV